MANTEAFDKYVSRVIDELLGLLNLQEWDYGLEHPDGFADDKSAQAYIDYSYLKINFYFGKSLKESFENNDFAWILEVLAHEIAHIYIDKIYKSAINGHTPPMMPALEVIREASTERISRLIVRLYKFEADKPIEQQVKQQ